MSLVLSSKPTHFDKITDTIRMLILQFFHFLYVGLQISAQCTFYSTTILYTKLKQFTYLYSFVEGVRAQMLIVTRLEAMN